MFHEHDLTPSELRHLTAKKKSVVQRCEELNFKIDDPMDALISLETYLKQLNPSTNGGGMSEYLIATGNIKSKWDIWSCAAMLVEWIDQELAKKEIDLELVDEVIVGGGYLVRVDEKLSSKNREETSSVDAMLMQLMGYLDCKVREASKCLDEISNEDATLAALYFMKRQGLAVTRLIGEKYKRHWNLSPVAYQMLQLTISDVSARKASELSVRMGVRNIKDPDDWQNGREAFLNEYRAVASKINVVSAWRQVGTMMIFSAKKYITFAGHEEEGGWLFTVARKGEKYGFESTSRGGFMHFTLLPFTKNGTTIVASPPRRS